jgi:hypothetical protein
MNDLKFTTAGDYMDQEKDKCNLCGVETEYTKDTHIDMRYGYVEGAGQFCRACATVGIDSTETFVHEYE